MKNYNELFNDRFEKSELIDRQFVEITSRYGIESGKKYLESIGATQLDMDNYEITYRISKWTENDLSKKEREDLLKELLNMSGYVTKVEFRDNEKFHTQKAIIKTKDGLIKAMRLSECAPRVKDIIPDIENQNRYGNCYKYAYYISVGLPRDNNLTTGYIYGYSDKSKYLHSWVETTIGGEEYVIDATLNAIINKEGYYRIQHAKPINKIDKQTFRDDLNKYSLIGTTSIPLEVYYVFRDEIIRDLEKNEFDR